MLLSGFDKPLTLITLLEFAVALHVNNLGVTWPFSSTFTAGMECVRGPVDHFKIFERPYCEY